MSKLEKCLYIVELLSRGKPLSLKEINAHWQYSSLYDDEIIPKTFGRYKEYISDVFAIDINAPTIKFVAVIRPLCQEVLHLQSGLHQEQFAL